MKIAKNFASFAKRMYRLAKSPAVFDREINRIIFFRSELQLIFLFAS